MELVLDFIAASCGLFLVFQHFKSRKGVISSPSKEAVKPAYAALQKVLLTADEGVKYFDPVKGRFQVVDVGPSGDFTLHSGNRGAEARKVYENRQPRDGNVIKFLDNGVLRGEKV